MENRNGKTHKTPGASGFAAKIIDNIDTANRMQQDQAERDKKVNAKVFNAYLTPNSLTYLQINGMSKDSIAMLYSKESTRKRHKSSIRANKKLMQKFSPSHRSIGKLNESPRGRKKKHHLLPMIESYPDISQEQKDTKDHSVFKSFKEDTPKLL